MTESEFQKTLKSVKSTMEMEYFEVSNNTIQTLWRIFVDGEDYNKILDEIIEKYKKEL
jgi:hypothetical protein